MHFMEKQPYKHHLTTVITPPHSFHQSLTPIHLYLNVVSVLQARGRRAILRSPSFVQAMSPKAASVSQSSTCAMVLLIVPPTQVRPVVTMKIHSFVRRQNGHLSRRRLTFCELLSVIMDHHILRNCLARE